MPLSRLDHPISVEARVLAGQLTPMGPGGGVTGIDKTPIDAPRWVSVDGLRGDHQGDLRHHGGPDKALHHYPFEHYETWRHELGPLPRLDAAGGFGENLSTLGWHEANTCLGDVIQAGSVLLQVSQGRQPCWKLNARFGITGLAALVQSTLRTGWYYRVLREGFLDPACTLQRVDRPHPEWPLQRILRLMFATTLDRDEAEAAWALPSLSPGWKATLRRRLDTGETERASARLEGLGNPA